MEDVSHLQKQIHLSPNSKLMFKMSNLSEEEISLEDLLKIDIRNLGAELLTIPIVLNHFGILLADATNNYNEAKFSLSIYEATLRETILENKSGGKKPTKEDIEAEIIRDKVFQVRKKKMYNKQREMEYINSIYWSLKSKDDKLNKLSLTIQSGDIEEQLMETRLKKINLVDIRVIRS